MARSQKQPQTKARTAIGLLVLGFAATGAIVGVGVVLPDERPQPVTTGSVRRGERLPTPSSTPKQTPTTVDARGPKSTTQPVPTVSTSAPGASLSTTPRIDGILIETTWPVIPNEDARSIAKGIAALASSYASALPDVLSMKTELHFILPSGKTYVGGFVAVSLDSMRNKRMYAETVEDNLVDQVNRLIQRKASFDAGD